MKITTYTNKVHFFYRALNHRYSIVKQNLFVPFLGLITVQHSKAGSRIYLEHTKHVGRLLFFKSIMETFINLRFIFIY